MMKFDEDKTSKADENGESRNEAAVDSLTGSINYQDTFCMVMKDYLCLKDYYFPTMSSRFVQYNKIEAVYYEPEYNVKGNSSCWVTKSKPIWWASDFRRTPQQQQPSHSQSQSAAQPRPVFYCVAIDCGETTSKGFHVENIEAFMKAVQPRLPSSAVIQGQFPGFGLQQAVQTNIVEPIVGPSSTNPTTNIVVQDQTDPKMNSVFPGSIN